MVHIFFTTKLLLCEFSLFSSVKQIHHIVCLLVCIANVLWFRPIPTCDYDLFCTPIFWPKGKKICFLVACPMCQLALRFLISLCLFFPL